MSRQPETNIDPRDPKLESEKHLRSLKKQKAIQMKRSTSRRHPSLHHQNKNSVEDSVIKDLVIADQLPKVLNMSKGH